MPDELSSKSYVPLGCDLTVAQVVRPQLLECSPEVSVGEAAARMTAARVSSIVVTEAGEALGIWTERDALRLDFSDPGAFNRPVREMMSSPVRSVSPELSLQDVVVRFREDRVRHYLVVDGQGRRLGLISQSDIIYHQGVEYYLHLREVESVVHGAPLVVDGETHLVEAARRMREHGQDAVIVDYGTGEHGILTERDLVRLAAERQADVAVGPLASRPLVTVPLHSSLFHARAVLLEGRLRHIGVVDGMGALAGLVSFTDILSGMELAYVHELRSALEQRDQALTASRRSLRLAEQIIENSPEGIMITDVEGRIESVNPAFTALTGYSEEEVVGRTPAVLSSGRHEPAFYRQLWETLGREGHWQGEIWNRRKDGTLYPELLTITAICEDDGTLSHYAALFSDISRLKESEETIRNLAYFDPLTGLPNRRLFEDRLRVAMAHAHRNRLSLAVLFVDLDRFKRINDSLGHAVGDQVLVEVARRLKGCIREDDTIARMGGDEFIMVLSEIASADDVSITARRIVTVLGEPVRVGEREMVVTASVGISLYPDDGEDLESLLANADAAMYRAKDAGRNSYQLYAPRMNTRSLEHLALENSLRKGLERGELCAFFQPLVDVRKRQVIGAEALLRWEHPDLGLVPPAHFIPLAEESGLIIPLGERVLRAACRQAAAWSRAGRRLAVSVNISPYQFRHDDFLAMVNRVLEEEAVEPSLLTFEVTETTLMDDADESIRILRELRSLGIGFALDDFGTGYSSLAYLKRFPIDILKIDRIFVRDIAHSGQDAAIVSAVIRLAHSLGLLVVAEGVEEAEQIPFLEQEGCDLLQGFHFGVPAPPEEFAEALPAGYTIS